MPGIVRAGRTAANRSSSVRSATLTLRKPVPTGVVIGPFRATRDERIASRTCSGSGVPSASMTPAGVPDVPVDRDAGRLEDGSRGVGDLRTDAVAGDERHAIGHDSVKIPRSKARTAGTRRCGAAGNPRDALERRPSGVRAARRRERRGT
jgi:hypothetical protein